MIKNTKNKAITGAENKDIGITEKVGRDGGKHIKVEPFMFPAQDGFPAMTIEAENIEEATKNYLVIRESKN